jgi:hypothetical protein
MVSSRGRCGNLGDSLHVLARLGELEHEARPVIGKGAGDVDAALAGNTGDENALFGQVRVGGSPTGLPR